MRKISLFIILLFIVIISIGFIPFNQRVFLKIDASYFNCYQQLFNVDGWQNWYPDAKNKKPTITLINSQNVFEFTFPGESVLVQKENSNTLSIRKVINKEHINYLYSIIPDSNPLITRMIVILKTNLINYVVPSLRKVRIAETNVNCFKSYMEDVKQYYGFDIRTQFTAEENTVVKSKIVLSGEAYAAVSQMQIELHDYITLKHLNRVGRVILQFIPKHNDSVQLLMGIPVNEKTVAESGFLYMYVPATRTVIADYTGKHQDRKAIYAALQKYLQDKYLHTKIPAFETYEGKMPSGGNDEISFKLNCPVF
jgi:effector-binding domain-containing protein